MFWKTYFKILLIIFIYILIIFLNINSSFSVINILNNHTGKWETCYCFFGKFCDQCNLAKILKTKRSIMHRTEGSGNVNNLFTDGPPATCIEQNIMNALQEEICNVVEGASLTLHTAATDTKDQLLEAINTLFIGSHSTGFVNRANFIWKANDEIYIDPGIYHHYGTTNQIVKWDNRLTFQLGPAGSNSNSSAIGNDTIQYVYLDDSAIVTKGNNIITASEILTVTTAPTWNNEKHGWYNGLDRCIFGLVIFTTGNIVNFYHDGNLILYQYPLAGGQTDKFDYDYTDIDIDLTWDDVYLVIPSFCRMAQVKVLSTYVDGSSALKWRTNGSAHEGVELTSVNIDSKLSIVSTPIITDENNIFEVKHTISNGNTSSIATHGFYLPNGM